MQVNTSGQMQQTHMRKMDGSGGGQGQGGGMKEMMQSLSAEDRTAFREQMSSLSESDRKTMKDQMAQLDTKNLSSDALAQSLITMLTSLQNPNAALAEATANTYA